MQTERSLEYTLPGGEPRINPQIASLQEPDWSQTVSMDLVDPSLRCLKIGTQNALQDYEAPKTVKLIVGCIRMPQSRFRAPAYADVLERPKYVYSGVGKDHSCLGRVLDCELRLPTLQEQLELGMVNTEKIMARATNP